MDFFRKPLALIFIYMFDLKMGCAISIVCEGVLEMDAGPVVPMGSDLRVLCRAPKRHCGRPFSIYLNGKAQEPLRMLNCSTVWLNLTNINTPKLELICKTSQHKSEWVICGQNLQSGYAPDKPTKFRCFAPRDSEQVECFWERGKETHLPTNFSVTFADKNGTNIFLDWNYNTTSLKVPWSVFDANVECVVNVKAQNALGEAVSDMFLLSAKDVEIPNTPKIISIMFKNDSMLATLTWQSAESEVLKPKVRIKSPRNGSDFGQEHECSEQGRGVLLLQGLQPLTCYEFQLQVCTLEGILKCSLWSPPVSTTSPGRAPKRKLDVWRIFGGSEGNGLRNVTVLWKPLSTEDYSGAILGYEVTYEHTYGGMEVVSCAANVTCRTLQLPRSMKVLHISAITSSGNSAPAGITLTHPGLPSPRVMRLDPVGEDRMFLMWEVYISWNSSLVCYVVQWQSSSVDVQWKRIPPENNFTYIEGLKPGIQFNVSLYAVALHGSSDPATTQAYSKEEVPLSGPKVSIQTSEETRILIRWEALELGQRRGFITSYNLHMRKCDTGKRLQNVTLAAPESGQMWLDTATTSFSLHVSASNSAGEGPEGEGVNCWFPPSPEAQIGDDPGVKISIAVSIPALIVLGLMYWNCARIKKTCISLAPQWLFATFPRVENSSVTMLLQERERSDSSFTWQSIYRDPPLTSVEEMPAVEDPTPDEGAVRTNPLLEEDSGYKPQISPLAPEEFLDEEDSLSQEGAACGLEGSEFLRRWPWDVDPDKCGPGPGTCIRPIYKLQVNRAQRDREEGYQDQTLLPDDLVSCLIGLSLEPGQDPMYVSQKDLRSHNSASSSRPDSERPGKSGQILHQD
ncbi:interleukin-23 receptor [Paramormyrops kingsleyae]|uniref:interleukin-23 receptor n=1 Tax=Paramormyrops kingsleyae TaxID=1676925 RepID=UPI003B969F54